EAVLQPHGHGERRSARSGCGAIPRCPAGPETRRGPRGRNPHGPLGLENRSSSGGRMTKLWSSDRPEFTERLAKLAGQTTYRTPNNGGTGKTADHLPDAHAIATALSFSRRGPDDVGPDVAYCWVLQTDAYRQKVVRKLSAALRCHEFRDARG